MSDNAKQPFNDTGWEFVDIYLFSNGQQQTPPRKYHLRMSDLNCWTETLKKLAQSQYENLFSTINLFTMEGQKVLTPMQISHGSTYVAVPPDDTFIHAGYNDYLMKASRSREKRKSNIIFSEQKVSVESNIHLDEVAKEEQILNIVDGEKTSEQYDTTAALNSSVINCSKIITRRVTPDLRNTSNIIKPIEKKLLNNKPIAGRKNSSITPPVIARKTSMKNKDNLVKKNLKVDTSNINPTDIIASSNNNIVSQSKSKNLTKINKSNPKDRTPLPIEISKHDAQNVSHDKNITTDGTVLNVLDDQELIVVKYPDSECTTVFLEKDKSATVFTRQTKLTAISPVLTAIHESEISEINHDIVAPINNKEENVLNNESANNDILSDKLEPITLGELGLVPESLAFSNKSLKSDDNYVSIKDKRDIVNLNLKIEVRKGDGTVSARLDQSPSKLNSITEKKSQPNLDEVFITCPAKQGTLPYSATDELTPKVIVIYCTCCDHHSFDQILNKVNSSAVKLEDTNYIILLPSPQSEKDVEISKKYVQTSNSPPLSPDTKSLNHPIKKVFASTWVHDRLSSTGSAKLGNDKTQENVANKVKSNNDIAISSSKVDVHIVKEDFNLENIKSKSGDKKLFSSNAPITKSKEEIFNSKMLFSGASRETDYSVRNSIFNTPKLTKETETQTEWCSVLLEARRHENGLYSFHLPPLHVLKYYGF